MNRIRFEDINKDTEVMLIDSEKKMVDFGRVINKAKMADNLYVIYVKAFGQVFMSDYKECQFGMPDEYKHIMTHEMLYDYIAIL